MTEKNHIAISGDAAGETNVLPADNGFLYGKKGFLFALASAILLSFLILGPAEFSAELLLVCMGTLVAVLNATAATWINKRALANTADAERMMRILVMHGGRFLILLAVMLVSIYRLESPYPFVIPCLVAYLFLKFNETWRLHASPKTAVGLSHE